MEMAAFSTTMKRGVSWHSLIVSWTLELSQINWVLWPWYTLHFFRLEPVECRPYTCAVQGASGADLGPSAGGRVFRRPF